MYLTKKQWNKHRKAIEWFYNQPKGAKVWFKGDADYDIWELTETPSWSLEYTYIINDEYAELRKAIADEKDIEFLDYYNKWKE